MRPTGPLPPGVYWVRRGLVVLVVLVVLVALWWVFLRSDAAPSTAEPTPSITPSVSSTPSSTASSTPSVSPTASSTSSPAQPDCVAKAIEVSVTTDRTSYPEGVLPVFSLTVTNTGDVTCRRDVGQQALELVVTSGDVQAWSSDDCNPGGPSAVRVFGPGDEFVQQVTWSRQLSEPGCPTGEPLADAGQYQVVARNLAKLSEPATFTLG